MPAVVLESIAYRGKLGVWNIKESTDELMNMLQLNDVERSLLESFNNNKRNIHWLGSRVLLRKMLDTHKFIEITPDRFGRPTLINFPHRVSISHSHEMAAVLISEDHNVGVDIELVDDKIRRIKQKFLSPEELERIDDSHESLHLTQCWCAKESLFKYYSKGHVDFRRDLTLEIEGFSEGGGFKGTIHKDNIDLDLPVKSALFGGYMLAYVIGEHEY